MAHSQAQVSVGVTATRLDAIDDSGDGVTGEAITVRNAHATDSVFLGGADVTTANGFELVAGAAYSDTLMTGDALYAIKAATTATVHVLRRGV